jgi:hypothetical protein
MRAQVVVEAPLSGFTRLVQRPRACSRSNINAVFLVSACRHAQHHYRLRRPVGISTWVLCSVDVPRSCDCGMRQGCAYLQVNCASPASAPRRLANMATRKHVGAAPQASEEQKPSPLQWARGSVKCCTGSSVVGLYKDQEPSPIIPHSTTTNS